MSMADLFPDAFKKNHIDEKKLAVGNVLYLHCDFTTPPKVKYLVVCCCDPLLVLTVNSEIHNYIKNNDEILACQVDLVKDDHEFLKWDSYISCIEAHQAFTLNEVMTELRSNYSSVYVGDVADYCMRSVYIAVGNSPVMSRRQKKQILSAMSEYQ
ncbi:hypothetical protein [Morganella morganii]|uniref:hypothetical protein n=1 Tax=Morganella morganii TaxID=582 RepID=UPI00301DF819